MAAPIQRPLRLDDSRLPTTVAVAMYRAVLRQLVTALKPSTIQRPPSSTSALIEADDSGMRAARWPRMGLRRISSASCRGQPRKPRALNLALLERGAGTIFRVSPAGAVARSAYRIRATAFGAQRREERATARLPPGAQ